MSNLQIWMCVLGYILLSYIVVALYFRMEGNPPDEHDVAVLILSPFAAPMGILIVVFYYVLLALIYPFACLAWGDKIKDRR